MEDNEKECNTKVRQLKKRLRLTNPDGEDPGIVAHFYVVWHKKLLENETKVTHAVRKLYIIYLKSTILTIVYYYRSTQQNTGAVGLLARQNIQQFSSLNLSIFSKVLTSSHGIVCL